MHGAVGALQLVNEAEGAQLLRASEAGGYIVRTAALIVSLNVLGVEPGDEVIVGVNGVFGNFGVALAPVGAPGTDVAIRGTWLEMTVPLPNCPLTLRPQHRTDPSPRRAQV